MLRRIFIVLVLAGLSFVIYKYVNPQGADALIEKVETTWNGWFSSNEVELIVPEILSGDVLTGDQMSGDLLDSLFGETTGAITSGDLAETDEWLEELEQEIETMLDEETPVETLPVTTNTNCTPERGITNSSSTASSYKPCCAGLTLFNPYPADYAGGSVVCYDASKGTPTCKYNATSQEGWYVGTTLLYAYNCDTTTTTTTPPPATKPVTTSPNTEYEDTKNIFDIFFQ